MIIDGHTHLCGQPMNEDSLIISYPDGGSFDLGIPRQEINVESMIEDMNTRGVEKAVVMGLPEQITNKELSDLVKQYPKRLIGFAGVWDPKKPEAVTMLEEGVKTLGLQGLKLHPGLHSFSPSDEEIVPLIKCAAELGVPTLIHSYPGGMRRRYFGLSTPEKIDDLKAYVPDATIIIGHMGYPRYLDLLTVGQIPGVYVETSWGLTSIAELHGLEFTAKYLRMIGIDKVLFGSDWIGKQLGMEQEKQLDLINKLDLTREEKDKILGGNISKLLNL
jgi:hypothetical protein